MNYRNSKAFERLTLRMMGVIALGTAANLGILLHLKNTGEFGALAVPNAHPAPTACCQA